MISAVALLILFMGAVRVIHGIQCGPGTKLSSDSSTCESLNNDDVVRAIHFLASPPESSRKCNRMETVQSISVCMDNIDLNNCVIWSTISSNYCDHYGSLEFEKYWSKKGCKVNLYHMLINFKGNVCSVPKGPMEEYPNIIMMHGDMWGGKCFNCVYKDFQRDLATTPKIDILKIQRREGVKEDFDGVQYTVLSDLFIHVPTITQKVNQIVYTASMNAETLTDTVGREGEGAWNMWASQQLLREYSAFQTTPSPGPKSLRPDQFEHLLSQAKIGTQFSYYYQSLVKSTPEEYKENQLIFKQWQPRPPPYELKGRVPGYCTVPSAAEDSVMQAWIKEEMLARCHPTRLAVPCVRSRRYDAIIPCPQELMDNLAEDYAASKLWCDFTHKAAEIEPLKLIDPGAAAAFSKPPLGKGKVRLAFFFTVYADSKFVLRLVNHLYSADHYYLFHIDNSGGSPASFEKDLRVFQAQKKANNNVFIAKDVKIVYGASTATILLTRAMAWFDKFATGWDYMVPLTGSDYPLAPLPQIEKIFAYQQPPMPFVMGWTPGTSTHIFRLGKTHPIFEEDPLLAGSIKAVTDERGAVLGAVPMEYRSGNFGPPLFCNNKSTFYHLDNRFNKSGTIYNTMWLFPRDVFKGRGRAYAEENRAYATPSFDGVWRVWKKSDPATTGAYDRETIKYIVNSEEGKKYWHFFKHMLLGSEEHYYISLLYNWERTKGFVQTLSAEMQWNTWELGLWEQSSGFQTHTHFLTLNEWDIIHGFAKRGMLFARKFSSKKTAALLDKIDEAFLLNATTDAGQYWPGFFEVDVTTPGKKWIAWYRGNQSLRAAASKKQKVMQLQMAAGKAKPAPQSATAIGNPLDRPVSI